METGVWPVLRIFLHGAFLFSIVFFLRRIHQLSPQAQVRHLGRPRYSSFWPMVLLGLVFSALLIYQASWQLTGLLRPEFVAFMQLHDRREFNPAHWIQRGKILDHRGEVLALSQEQDGQARRVYPFGGAFAHVVGYSHPRFGSAGLESLENVRLNGGAPDDWPAWGELGLQVVTQKPPRGEDLRLCLDADLQLLAVRLMEGRSGAIVAIRPDDGAVRVLASSPSIDPNRLSPALFQGMDPATPLLNRATQGLYPPGSSFKVVLAAQALNSGFQGTLNCPAEGFTTSPRFPKIRDHEYYEAKQRGGGWEGYGDLTLAKALAKSSNVFFAKLGVSLGMAAFYQNLEQFHFNRPISLREGGGRRWSWGANRVPALDEQDLYGLAQMSVGQGRMLATPAHMALIAAAIANQGVAMRPRLLEKDPPQVLAQFTQPASARRVADMMRGVVTEGTGRPINLKELAIAGKTGTAENPHGNAHSWFIGFAPAGRPRLAVAVLMEQGGYGARVAAPIAQQLLSRAQQLGMLE